MKKTLLLTILLTGVLSVPAWVSADDQSNEQAVDSDGFHDGHGNKHACEDFAGNFWVSTHGFDSFGSQMSFTKSWCNGTDSHTKGCGEDADGFCVHKVRKMKE